ncbi:hypothetical protein [Ideonella sp. YS5]|uniref:hypothetical protein n=1 Tax=Ideonella sp. YS5 TaxID=3453714 RepID=UPI003EF055C1
MDDRSGWRVVASSTMFFGFWGPLIGVVPYVWMVISVPFAYVLGGVPALVCGLLFGLWQWKTRRNDVGPWARAARGALCGLAGCAVFGLAISHAQPSLSLMSVLALHGVPAGAILGACRRTGRPVKHSSLVCLTPQHGSARHA